MRGVKEFLPSFGRRQGHKLREQHQQLFETLLPKLRLTPLAKGYFYQADAIVPGSRGLRLELGFGGGEHLAAQARLHPDIGFIGGEPFVNGVASMLAHIQKDGLTNIRVVDDDIRPVMASLPDGCLEGIYVLFPDPWPKPKTFQAAGGAEGVSAGSGALVKARRFPAAGYRSCGLFLLDAGADGGSG